MRFDTLLHLIGQSIIAPRDMARRLIDANLSGEALWTAGALVVALNALVFGLSHMAYGPAQPMILSPALYAVLLALVLGLLAPVLAFTGRLLGGQGRAPQIAVVLFWLQGLRSLAQVVILLLLPVSPSLSSLVLMATVGLGLYLTLIFVDEAHGLNNLFATAGALILSTVGLVLALAVALTALGLSPTGMNGYV